MLIAYGIITSTAIHDRASWVAKMGWQIRRAKGAQSE